MSFWALAGLLIIVFVIGFVIGLFEGAYIVSKKENHEK